MKKLLVQCTHRTTGSVCGFHYHAAAEGANPDLILAHAQENPGHVIAVTVHEFSGG